jgi:acetate kinase
VAKLGAVTNRDLVNILVFNPGSSSLKFEIVACEPPTADVVSGKKLVSGVVEPIDSNGKLSWNSDVRRSGQIDLPVKDHGEAAMEVLKRIDSGALGTQSVGRIKDFQIIGHRVVHRGDGFTRPALIDDEVISRIEKLRELAPLHNEAALAVIKATQSIVGRQIPSIAVFDTAFHRTIPERARVYGIPWDLTVRHRIGRSGFHGISHKYLLLRYAQLTLTPIEQAKIISLHLEGGASATAIVGGKSIDTSMGFTPLEGLMMGTRSGDLDPAIVGYLARKENVGIATVEEWLNKKSGLLGISGSSQDTRILVKQAATDDRSRLALDVFAYRVRKYIGAYLAAMDGAAAIVFGGGIGENTPVIRRQICEGLRWFGLDFDDERNLKTIDQEGQITRDGSRLHAFVIPTEEGLMIAHETLRFWIDSISHQPAQAEE